MTSVSFAPNVKVIKHDIHYNEKIEEKNNDDDNNNNIICNLWYTNEEFEAITKEATESIKDMNICGTTKNDYNKNNNNINIDDDEESFCYRGLESLNRGKIFGCAKWLNRIVFLEQERQWGGGDKTRMSSKQKNKPQQLNAVLIAKEYSKFTKQYANEARITGHKDQKAAVSSYLASPSLNDPRLLKIKEAIMDCE